MRRGALAATNLNLTNRQRETALKMVYLTGSPAKDQWDAVTCGQVVFASL
jgi:hypothetical protein